MSTFRLIMIWMALVGIGMPTLAFALDKNTLWVHDPIFACLKAMSGMLAIVSALCILFLESKSKGSRFNREIFSALSGLGALNFLQALFYASAFSSWIYVLSNFVAAFLLFPILFPQLKRGWVAITIFSVTSFLFFGIGVIYTLSPNLSLSTIIASYNLSASSLNMLFLFLIAATGFKLILTFKTAKNYNNIAFACFCLALAMSSIFSDPTRIWTLTWWNWHLAHFFIYAGIASYLINEYSDLQRSTFADVTERTRQLVSIVDSSEDAIIGMTMNGIITSWNKGAETIFGYTEKEVEGQSVLKLFPVEKKLEVESILSQMKIGASISQMITQRIRKDKTVFDASATFSQIRNRNGVVVGISEVVRDISKTFSLEKEIRARERQLSTLVNAAPVCLLLVDANGIIIQGSEQASHMFGYNQADLIGQPIESIVPDALTQSRFDHHLAHYNSGVTLMMGSGEVIFARNRDGKAIPIEIGLSMIPSEQGNMFVVAVIDISERIALQTTLKESISRFELAVEGSSVGIVDWFNIDSEKQYWSPRLHHLLGIEPGEIETTRTNFINLIHPDDRDLASKVALKHIRGEGDFDVECRFQTKSGAYKWFHCTGICQRLASGKASRMVGSIQDIDERKSLQEAVKVSEKNFRSIVENMPIGFSRWVLSEANEIAFSEANRYFENTFKIQTEAIKGSLMQDIFPHTLANGEMDIYRDVIFHGGLRHLENARYEYGSKVFWFDSHVFQPHPREICFLFRDITEQKKLEINLANSNRELEQFAYIASHDLKTPLRGVQTYCDILVKNHSSSFNEDGKSLIRDLVEQVKAMELFVSDLLTYSKIGSTDLAVKLVPLNIKVSRIIESIRLYLQEKNAKILGVESLPSWVCDEVRVGEIFKNLIENGVKYNEREEKIIQIGYSDDPKKGRVFFVKDNGIGIKQKHFDNIFTIFKRLHTHDAYGGGTGAGLTIVKKIIEKHEGKIWLESEIGIGSTFFFTLPSKENRSPLGVES